MPLSRRGALAGLAATAACAPSQEARGGVLAAGQPAAVLLSALAPKRMIGWPRRPPPTALTLIGGDALPETGALSGGGAPAGLEAVAALRPRMIVDYGDVNRRFAAIATRTQAQLGVPYHLVDGALARIPWALARAGVLVGERTRGDELADRAAGLLAKWRNGMPGARTFYYARGRDGLETGFAGSLATQVLEGGGWTNLATGTQGIGRVGREQIAAWNPDVVVTLDREFAREARSDPLWAQRRVLLLPDLPFGWIDRPPSINRLLGCAWMTGGEAAAHTAAAWLWRIPPARLRGLTAQWLG